MIFPALYLLIAYAVFLFVCGIFVIVNVMHILAFGLQNIKTAIVALMYIGAAALVLLYSFLHVILYDWNTDIEIGGAIGSFISVL